MEEQRKIVAAVDSSGINRAAKRWRFDAGHPKLRGPLQRPGNGGDLAPRRDDPKPS